MVTRRIRWLSAPASLANLVLLGWLLGVQYARAPVILLVVGNILNIVLDVWLVMGLHMNVQGAALATVIADYATLLIGLLMVRKILKLRGISGEMLKAAWRGNFRRLLALNRDIMLRSNPQTTRNLRRNAENSLARKLPSLAGA